MMDDGESRLQEFLRAEEKRGPLCNLMDASGPPNQSPSDWCQFAPWLCLPHQEQKILHLFKCYPAHTGNSIVMHTTNLALECTGP